MRLFRTRVHIGKLFSNTPQRIGVPRQMNGGKVDMEMHKTSIAIATNSVVTEMLALVVGAMLAGLAAATVASSLVVALTVIGK